LNLKANLADPSFTGIPVAPSAVAGTSTDQIATTAFVTSGLALKANLAGPTFTGTVSGITKAMVGLTNVDDTSDASKPVSNLTQSALNLKANLADPSFTGTVSAGSISTTSTITSTGGFIGTSYQPSAATTAITFGNNITTGNIDIGAAQTTGNLNLGIGTSREATGNIFIGTGASALNTINIGRGNVISIVNSETPTLTINRPILTTGNPSTLTTAIGSIVSVSSTSGVVGPPSTGSYTLSSGAMTLGSGVWLVSLHINYITASSINNSFRWNIGLMTNVPVTGNNASASKAPTNTIGSAWVGDSDGVGLDNGTYGQQLAGIVLNNYDGSYNTLYGIFNYSQTAAGATGTLNGTITLMATKIA
jgi:hypothetical protein